MLAAYIESLSIESKNSTKELKCEFNTDPRFFSRPSGTFPQFNWAGTETCPANGNLHSQMPCAEQNRKTVSALEVDGQCLPAVGAMCSAGNSKLDIDTSTPSLASITSFTFGLIRSELHLDLVYHLGNC